MCTGFSVGGSVEICSGLFRSEEDINVPKRYSAFPIKDGIQTFDFFFFRFVLCRFSWRHGPMFPRLTDKYPAGSRSETYIRTTIST